jgi:GAF domain-containing protein
MGEPRLENVLAAVTRQRDEPLPLRMCRAASDLLAAPGVGIDLQVEGSLRPVAATEQAERGEQLQADLGEGPCYDATRNGAPVLVPDLARDRTWPTFGPAAVAAGIASAFSFPLRSGAVRLGAFNFYRGEVSHLTDDQHADALIFARLVTDLLISLQSEMPELELHEFLVTPEAGFGPSSWGWQVHQATGMVAAQLDLPVADALARLRAHAFATGRTVKDVSADVVARRLRFEEDV